MREITYCAGDPSDILLDRASLPKAGGTATPDYNWSESGRQDSGRAQRVWMEWQDVERERSEGDPAGSDSRRGWPLCHSGI
jgi:hypothetical protein